MPKGSLAVTARWNRYTARVAAVALVVELVTPASRQVLAAQTVTPGAAHGAYTDWSAAALADDRLSPLLPSGSTLEVLVIQPMLQ